MGQVLSQEEVDALLSAVSEGITDEEKPLSPEEHVALSQALNRSQRTYEDHEVRPYDITSQDRIFRGKMPMMEVIHEKFCRDFRSSLSIELRRVVDVEVGDIRLVKFGEFLNGLSLPTSINLFKMDPLRGMGAMIVESSFAFVLVNIFLGGVGKSRFRVEGRDFSAIELNIVRKVVSSGLFEFQKAWEAVEPVKVKFERTEINPQFVSIAHPTEIVMVIESSVDVEGSSGLIQIVMPYAMIEPMREKLSSGFLGEGAAYDDSLWRETITRAVLNSKVNVTARLGQMSMSVDQLTRMKVGQEIILDQFADEPVELVVEGTSKFDGHVGVQRGYKAVRIHHIGG
ncbi:MAG: flagellar motor switch protein FliM [Candidatus Lernaella stagnicola]|nr:flagellar motor switch protein FliM [Candidatus Lernaella stagnicola]